MNPPTTRLQPTTRLHPAGGFDPSLRHAGQCLLWGWILIGGACVMALVPIVGFLAWIIGPPLIVAGFVLAVIAMTKGRTGGGIGLLLFSLVVAPATLLFAPIVVTMIGGAAASAAGAGKLPKASPPPGFVPADFDPQTDDYPVEVEDNGTGE
ncbi:hypothetical protein [Luteolibacter marinus]|uniref:hypothetical protein n=1 Tax=Luteolibacter marinus TaxID=2776705 RepID=UPI0018668167|nr:hypothetical protein [Luteolibacter marinus]